MRILVTVAHYYDPHGGGKYTSLSPNASLRVAAVNSCVAALHQAFGKPQGHLDNFRKQVVPANQPHGHDLDVVLCTTRGKHLIGELAVPNELFRHHATQAEPLLLGFECQALLRDGRGRYDCFCYLEDDLVLRDPWFFRKLDWFTGQFGEECLLQPNRYEVGTLKGPVRKLFLDGDLRPAVTEPFQDVHDRAEVSAAYLGGVVRFRRPTNPHSGCYFLTAAQMDHWAKQPYFLDRDTRFIGPLESAATLGVLRTFRLYKPAAVNMDFLEVQHYETKHLRATGGPIPFAADSGAGLQPATAAPERQVANLSHEAAASPYDFTGLLKWNEIQGFFTLPEALALQRAVKQLPAGAQVAELGCFQGRSSVALAAVLPPGGVLHCVDTFQGCLLQPGQAPPPPEEKLRINHGAFARNLEAFGVKDRVRTYVSTTAEASRQFAPASLDLLFVDAGHDYGSVKQDLELWYPKLKAGGWLFCDDYIPKFPGVMQAIQELGVPGTLAAESLWCHRKP